MSNDRYVVLGLAHVRSAWFREVSRWATSAVMPIDFVKCVSIDELRARLASGRAFSAIVADAGLAGVDRDLIDLAREIGCAVILVDHVGARRDALGLGVSALLPDGFGRDELLAVLDEHATPIGAAVPEVLNPTALADPTPQTMWRGRVIAVTGPGGTGSSVCAMALAHGLAHDVRSRGDVLLADLALDADQAMLHDARDIVPGLQELVDAFRHGTPSNEEVVGLTFGDDHAYRLLLGLRRHRDWTALRPRAWLAAFDALRRTFTHVVADIDADVEGEAECGSVDVEERNLLARSVVDTAEVIVVTAHPGPQGVHRLVRVVSSLLDNGVRAERILPVVNRAPRAGRARAEITRTVAELTEPLAGPQAGRVAPPLYLGEHRRLDLLLRDGVGVPDSMATALTRAVTAIAARTEALPVAKHDGEPSPVVPGSLGSWATSQEAAG